MICNYTIKLDYLFLIIAAAVGIFNDVACLGSWGKKVRLSCIIVIIKKV